MFREQFILLKSVNKSEFLRETTDLNRIMTTKKLQTIFSYERRGNQVFFSLIKKIENCV